MQHRWSNDLGPFGCGMWTVRDPKRIPRVLALIESIWKANPDLRLGQLIENGAGEDMYFLEDEELESCLHDLYIKQPLREEIAICSQCGRDEYGHHQLLTRSSTKHAFTPESAK